MDFLLPVSPLGVRWPGFLLYYAMPTSTGTLRVPVLSRHSPYASTMSDGDSRENSRYPSDILEAHGSLHRTSRGFTARCPLAVEWAPVQARCPLSGRIAQNSTCGRPQMLSARPCSIFRQLPMHRHLKCRHTVITGYYGNIRNKLTP